MFICTEAIKIAEPVTVDEVGEGTTPPWTMHESNITAFASKAMRFTEQADEYEAKIAGLQEKLPAIHTRIDELRRQLNQS